MHATNNIQRNASGPSSLIKENMNILHTNATITALYIE